LSIPENYGKISQMIGFGSQMASSILYAGKKKLLSMIPEQLIPERLIPATFDPFSFVKRESK
jgi:hypothetical protein